MEAPFGFGGQERPVDKRDFPLGKIQAPQIIPNAYFADLTGVPTHHQHKLPTCGANALSGLQELKLRGSYSPRYSWVNIKKIDGYPLDAGTDMRSIFKSAASDGVCDIAVAPDDSTMDLQPYSDPAFVTQTMKDTAQPYLVQSYAFLEGPFTMNAIKQAIYANGSVLALVQVGDEWYTAPSGATSWQEKDVLPLRPPQSVVSGHFIVLYGYDDQYIYFKNSWGTEWGRGGIGYFGSNYLPYVREVGTAVDADPNEIRKLLAKKNILQRLVSLWQQLRAAQKK